MQTSKIVSFGASEKGEDHHEDEDTILIDDNLGLYAVADGVTIPHGGGLASRLAIKTLRSQFKDNLEESIEQVNKIVLDEKKKAPQIGSTTLTAAHLTDSRLQIAHVGDSYGLVIRNARVILRTEPQNRDGFLTNTIGGHFEGIKIYKQMVEPGDYIVLATDGVTAILGQDEIASIVTKNAEPRKIVKHALREVGRRPRQYRDDRSMVVIRTSPVLR